MQLRSEDSRARAETITPWTVIMKGTVLGRSDNGGNDFWEKK